MVGGNNANPESLAASGVLFKPANWLAKIDFINQLVMQNNVLVAVLAEHGGGKTSFSRLLEQEIGASVQSHLYRACPGFSSKNLLADLANYFHISIDESTTMINMVEHINQQNTHFLLIIDDAQNVPPVFLQEMMMNIKHHDDNMFFHVCLVSDFKILKHLHKLEADQFSNLIHTIELGTLTERETNTWVLNKTNAASSINNTKLEEFYQLTGGSVARINSQMDDFFRIRRALPLSKFKKSTSMRFGQVASVIFVLVLVNWFWKTDQYSSIATKKIAENDVKPSAANLNIKAVEAALQSAIPAYSLASTIQSLQPSSRNLVIDYGDGEEENGLGNLVLMDKVVVLPTIAAAHHSVKPAKLVSSLPSVGKLAAMHTTGKIASRYTIQLLASKQRSELDKFISTQPVPNQFKIALTKRNGKDWYVLTMGEFERKAVAQQVIHKLPAKMTIFSPWVRPAKDLRVIG